MKTLSEKKKNPLYLLWLRHQKGFIIKWKYCKSRVRQDAGAHAHRNYCWSDNIKHLDCWDFSIPDFPMSCTTKQGRIPSSGMVEGWQWRSAETLGKRGWCIQQTQTGAGRSLEHPGPWLEVPMEMPSLRKCWGREEMHQTIPVPTLMSTSVRGLGRDGDVFLPLPLLQWLLQCSEVWLHFGKNCKFSGFSKYYIKGKNYTKPTT